MTDSIRANNNWKSLIYWLKLKFSCTSKCGDETFIAAGSTITDDVPDYALAIARGRQVNKEDWNRK